MLTWSVSGNHIFSQPLLWGMLSLWCLQHGALDDLVVAGTWGQAHLQKSITIFILTTNVLNAWKKHMWFHFISFTVVKCSVCEFHAAASLMAASRAGLLDSLTCLSRRPQENIGLTHWGRDEIDDILQTTFSIWISIKISPKFVPKGPINNIRALVQIMAWRRPGDKPLSEPIVVRSLTHICVTRPQ